MQQSKRAVVVGFEIVFTIVVGLSVVSGGVATGIALAVDTRRRPAAKIIVDRLTQIALLGATAIIALLPQLRGS